jgi:hypothetical protein
MQLNERHMLEKAILAKIDLLIEIISSMELCEDHEQEELKKRGSALIIELRDLLAQLIGPEEGYVHNAIVELISQRMPGHDVENRLEDLMELVDRERRNEQEYQQEEDNVGPISPPDPLQKAVNFLFSQCKVLKNYRYQGLLFSYYIPSLKVAVDNCAELRAAESARKEYVCRKAEIRLISLNCPQLSCSRGIIREIKRGLT